MRRILWYGLPLFLLLGACAPRRPAMAELPTNEEPQPELGIVQWVETHRISILLVGAPEPRRYVRTKDTRVFRGGEEVSWAEIQSGQAVRFQSVKGPFSPLRVTAVEILEGEEEDTVRRQILARWWEGERCRRPCLRNLHVSVGRGS